MEHKCHIKKYNGEYNAMVIISKCETKYYYTLYANGVIGYHREQSFDNVPKLVYHIRMNKTRDAMKSIYKEIYGL